MNGYHIRVTKNENNTFRYEMMDGDYKLRDVTDTEIINMVQQFVSALRWR